MESKEQKKKIPPGFFLSIGVAIGAGLGVVLKNIAVGAAIGIGVGVALETANAKKNKGK